MAEAVFPPQGLSLLKALDAVGVKLHLGTEGVMTHLFKLTLLVPLSRMRIVIHKTRLTSSGLM